MRKTTNNATPAPAWFRKAEVYNGWYTDWTDRAVRTRLPGFPVIVGVPHAKLWVDKAHRAGVKVIPYVSFYKALNIAEGRKGNWNVKDNVVCDHYFLRSPFWQELNLEKHPEWLLYREDGQVRRPFDAPKYARGYEQCCTNAPGYREAALRGVRALMDLGVDGLFIDNIHPHKECFGEKLGKHRHVQPGADNEETFKEVLDLVYKCVKGYGKDKLVMTNPGGVHPGYWYCSDAMMWESYIVGSASKERADWKWIMMMAESCQQAIAQGKAVVALSYFGKARRDHVTDDAFFCYACARLSGFLWADWFTLPKDNPAQALFRIRLGAAAGAMENSAGLYLRRFAKGLVTVNPTDAAKSVEVKIGPGRRLKDVYTGAPLSVRGSKVALALPPQSGRVFVHVD